MLIVTAEELHSMTKAQIIRFAYSIIEIDLKPEYYARRPKNELVKDVIHAIIVRQ